MDTATWGDTSLTATAGSWRLANGTRCVTLAIGIRGASWPAIVVAANAGICFHGPHTRADTCLVFAALLRQNAANETGRTLETCHGGACALAPESHCRGHHRRGVRDLDAGSDYLPACRAFPLQRLRNLFKHSDTFPREHMPAAKHSSRGNRVPPICDAMTSLTLLPIWDTSIVRTPIPN